MIHSRPGYTPRTDDTAPAKLQQDMIPAINRKAAKQEKQIDRPSFEAMLTARAEEHRAAKAHPTPEVIVNPAPSATPLVLEPGK